MDEKRWKGNLTELAVAKALMNAGHVISFPFGEGQRYDIIVDMKGVLKKVECKTARLKEGFIEFNCSGTNGPYTDQIDFFGCYCIELDKTYLVPIEEVGINKAHLRIQETKSGQKKGIRWANDYEI